MENNIDLRLMTILLRSSQSIEAAIRHEVAQYNLNPTEFGVLEVLYHKGMLSIQSIMEKILIAKSSMSYCLEQLVHKNLVRKQQDDHDRRIYFIELTNNGKLFMDKMFPKHIKFINNLFNSVDEENKNTLVKSLKEIGLKAQSIKEDK